MSSVALWLTSSPPVRFVYSRAIVSTDSDAAATTALLRAPAAIASGAFIVGLVTGVFARPLSTLPGSAVTLLLTLIVCLPFLLPTEWYRRYRVLWMWMAAAAAFASVRAVVLAGWFLPYQTMDVWILKTAIDVFVAGMLWLSVSALRRP